MGLAGQARQRLSVRVGVAITYRVVGIAIETAQRFPWSLYSNFQRAAVRERSKRERPRSKVRDLVELVASFFVQETVNPEVRIESAREVSWKTLRADL